MVNVIFEFPLFSAFFAVVTWITPNRLKGKANLAESRPWRRTGDEAWPRPVAAESWTCPSSARKRAPSQALLSRRSIEDDARAAGVIVVLVIESRHDDLW
jgi:hypothetical protein